MLQFLKKGSRNGQQKHNVVSSLERQKIENLRADRECKTGLPPPLPLSSFDDEGLFDIGENESSKEHSRLTRTLADITSDKNALGYLLQYMESKNASSYLLCWLDIEAFKLYLEDISAQTKAAPHSPQSHSQIDHDSLSVSTDCDSYTADSNSLCDYISDGKSPQDSPCDTERSDSSVRLKNEESSNDKRIVQNTIDRALDIFKKYIALESDCNVKCTEDSRKEVMENICSTTKVLSTNCFDAVQNFVYKTIEDDYFNAFLESDHFCKYQIDLLTCGNVVLSDILYNETALFYFMEFLEQENQRCLLEFWIAASNFQQQIQDQKEFFDPLEAQTDAVVLYDKYFSLQALCPLGFSDKVRFAVEQSICGEDGLTLHCFHLPLKIVESVLEKQHLKPFLESQLFYKYLSDLINAVQSNSYANVEKYKHAASDCSSEKSFGQGTFLAFEVPRERGRDKGKEMTIDTRELYDPDALWKRKKAHRLSLGRVSELGKYETEFEPEPDRRQFRFKNVLRKVISLEEDDRKKEEMAWQVAELIVKDITKVTLGNETGGILDK
ncbi:unnamed protein product [Phyllotreta striolata]|uniref:RGS domain-containing protein n=1 Tax=Phyllotreta striolata TaxID=444603 RepID=A0A9N9XK02_PHYSR|nr:unnamed protein product [Phyllotreta striolata]